MRRVIAAVVVIGALSAASACSSSSPAPARSQLPPTAASTPAATAPISTPATSPTPSKSAALSPFESDPAVQAMRAWAAEGGRTVNSGHYTSPALRKLVTANFASRLKRVFGEDVGTYYPGPVPLQPLGVTVVNSTNRTIKVCAMLDGWAQNAKTHEPAHARRIASGLVEMEKVHGRWVVDAFDSSSAFTCKGVKIATTRW